MQQEGERRHAQGNCSHKSGKGNILRPPARPQRIIRGLLQVSLMSAFADRSSEQHKASQGCAPPVGFDLYQEHVAPRHPPRARPQRPRPPPTHRKAATARAPAALSPTKPGNFPSEPPKLRQQLNFRSTSPRELPSEQPRLRRILDFRSTSPRELPSEQPRLRRILDFRLGAFLPGSFSNLPILSSRVQIFL